MPSFLAYLCISLATLLSEPNPKLLAARLEARYRAPRTLQATFLERYTENDQLIRTEAGLAYFRRPGKMRWEYQSPERNLFLVDGKTAWFYVPADHTVTRAPAKLSEDWRTPLALLAGEMKLSRICARIELAATEVPSTASNVVLECPLRGQNKLAGAADAGNLQDHRGAEQTVYLEVEPETGDLARVLVRETGGVSVDFRFTGWQFDPTLPDSFFRFDVPTGVAIVNGETGSQSRP